MSMDLEFGTKTNLYSNNYVHKDMAKPETEKTKDMRATKRDYTTTPLA